MHVALSFPLGMAVWVAIAAVWPNWGTLIGGPLIVSAVVLLAGLLPIGATP